MQAIIGAVGVFFGWLLKICYALTGNFGWAIWIFTALTKVLMLPISVVVQKNSIKMVKLYPEMNRYRVIYHGDKDMISESQYSLYKREKYHPALDLIPVMIQLVLLMGVVEGIRSLAGEGYSMGWLGIDLGMVPIQAGGEVLLIPAAAAVSALIMCITQNISNVIQSEQGRISKFITLSISVGLSLYLGLFVPAGIGLYWTASNLFSVAVMYFMNWFIDPRKYVDYDALEKSKKLLEESKSTMARNKKRMSKEQLARERRDYRSFMRYEGKQIVFYAEGRGFYKYFKDVIESIINRTDIVVHYITNDYSDNVFDIETEQFRTYYISENKLIILMMKMEADIVVMTTPDLQRYHIKRSIVKKDIEYIYIDHSIGSINMTYRKHALDYFDTIFASNQFAVNEVRGMEKTYGLKEKKIVKYGYCLIDNMIGEYKQKETNNRPVILIAPSWHEENIMDICIEDILETLTGKGYMLIVRPHPQYVRHNEQKLKELKDRYSGYHDFELQTDFSSNKVVYDADILLTDWSGIAYEYSLATLKPTLFIDTPMKVMNPDYAEIGVEPMDLEIRNRIGISIAPKEIVNSLEDSIERLLHEEIFSSESIRELRERYLFNVGCSAKAGADYIINSLIDKSRGKNANG